MFVVVRRLPGRWRQQLGESRRLLARQRRRRQHRSGAGAAPAVVGGAARRRPEAAVCGRADGHDGGGRRAGQAADQQPVGGDDTRRSGRRRREEVRLRRDALLTGFLFVFKLYLAVFRLCLEPGQMVSKYRTAARYRYRTSKYRSIDCQWFIFNVIPGYR